ncbi:MAG: PKD domain-containing protein, partial [Pedobacter sp.]
TYGFELTVTDNQGLAGKDSVLVTLNNIVPTNWPPQVSPLCNKPYKIVVVGSSTAYGTGASPIDSSWVKKFTTYVQIQNPLVSVVNIATLSLTSYDVSPTGTPVPSPYLIDTARNITKALSLNPDAIILSLPSNDVARGIPAADIHTNFNLIVAAATARQIPVWVTTTQARNTLSAAERVLQMELRDWIINTYGNKAVDFWSTISNADGTINEFYSAGDGVHLNNYGHHVLFTRMVAEKIWDSLCARTNQAPIANAGRDTSVSPNTGLVLSATGSSDPDGDVITYNWRVVNSSNATITSANTASPVFTATAAGLFRVELKVSDTYGKAAYDTVAIQVSPVNVPPVAYAGIDQLVVKDDVDHLAFE